MFSRALVLFAVAIIAASDDDGCVDLSDDCYDYEINPSICHSSLFGDDDGTENCCICGGGDTSAAASCTSAGDCASGLCDVSAADCSACGSVDETNLQLWLRADDLDCVLNDEITSWADASSNGYTASQYRSVGVPYCTGAQTLLNGHSAARFGETTTAASDNGNDPPARPIAYPR